MDFDLFELDEDDEFLLSALESQPNKYTEQNLELINLLPEFNCNGEDSLNSEFSVESFIKNYAIFSKDFQLDEEILLTNYDFIPDSLHSKTIMNFVFNQARSNIQKIFVSVNFPIDLDGMTLYKLRRQVTLLYHLLCSSKNPLEWSQIENYLQSIRKVINSFENLEFFNTIFMANSTRGNETESASYHALHGYLEWKFLDLILIYKNEGHYTTNEENCIKISITEQFNRIIMNGIQITICLFKKKNLPEIALLSAFPCTCIKEFWLLLQIFTENCDIKFWGSFNDAIQKIQNDPEQYEINSTSVADFTIWIFKFLIKMQGYNTNGKFLGPKSTRVVENFELLEMVTENFLNQDPTEERIRIFLCNLLPITLEWWSSKANIPMILWEYFHKKLNSSFFIAGSAPSNLAVSSSSGKKYIDKIRTMLENQNPDANNSSFTIFIFILGKTLKNCYKNGQTNQLQKILGRIFSKFTATKLLALNEIGLHNLIELFLVLALSTEFAEVSQKLKDLLLSIRLDKIQEKRQKYIIKGHVALLILFTENSLDVSNYVKKILEQLSSIKNDLNVCKILADGLCDIFENVQNFDKGEHTLIDSWLSNYLYSSTVEQERTLEAIHIIFNKLKLFSNSLFGLENVQSLIAALNVHILPFVKQNFINNTSDKLLTLASDFCILIFSNDVTIFHKNINFFLESNCVNKMYVIKFLLVLLSSDKRNLIDQQLIIKIWLRNLVVLSSNNEDVLKLSGQVSNLSEFRSVCELNESDLLTAKEPLCAFISAVGKNYNECGDYEKKNLISDKFNFYVNGFDKWILEKNEKAEIKIRFFSFIAIVIYNCANIVYARSKITCFFHIAFSRFILPTQILVGKLPEPKLAQIIHKIWSVLIQGIGTLNYRNDQYVTKTLVDLITKWTPHFKISQNPKNVARPFVNCIMSENDQLTIFVFEKLTNVFLGTQRRQSDPNACLVISIFQEVTDAISNDSIKMIVFMKSSLLSIFEHIMMVDEITPSRQLLLEILKKIFRSSAFQENSEIKELVTEYLKLITIKHLPYYTFFYFDLLTLIVNICVEIISNMMDFIYEQVNIVEAKRGGGEDNKLRNRFNKLKGAISAAKFKSCHS